jgi:hypothetical protein
MSQKGHATEPRQKRSVLVRLWQEVQEMPPESGNGGDANFGDAVVRFAFEHCENTYLSPTWWDGLDEASKLALRRRITNAADVTVKRQHGCLMYDGYNYVTWTDIKRETNLPGVIT